LRSSWRRIRHHEFGLDLLFFEPVHPNRLRRADLRDRFEPSGLPLRVDVVEARAIAAASIALTDL
jgi:hypothetical protein